MKETAIITFGRFTPPHAGHVKYLEKMSVEARKRNADQLIYLSHSFDSDKNPLVYSDKIRFLRLSVPKLSNRIVETDAFRPLHILNDVYKRGYKNLIIFVGAERTSSFEDIIRRYNGVMDKANPFYFENFKVVNANIRTMSASEMRGFASVGDIDSFMKNASPYMTDRVKKEMWDAVRRGMNIKEGFIPKFRNMISEDTRSTLSTFDAIVNTYDKSPTLFFTPSMWKRLQKTLSTFEGWHITDPEVMKDVMKIAGTRKTISVTTKLEGIVVTGLRTKGGVAMHLRGEKIFGLNTDFYTQRTREGIKIKSKLPDSQLKVRLSSMWRDVILQGLREFYEIRKSNYNEENAFIYDIVESAISSLKRITSEETLGSTKVSIPSNISYTGIKTVSDVFSKFFRGLKNDRVTDFNFSSSDKKRIGSIMASIVKNYLDGTEKILKELESSDFDLFIQSLEGQEGQPWDEHLLSNFEVVKIYQYVDGLEDDYPELEQYDFLPLKALRAIKMNESRWSFTNTSDNFLTENWDLNLSTFDVIIKRIPLFLTPSVIKRLSGGEFERVKGWHVTGYENVEKLIKIQNKRNSISIARNITNQLLHGITSGGGYLVSITGNKMIESPIDLASDRTKEGIRFIEKRKLNYGTHVVLNKAWSFAAKKALDHLKTYGDKEVLQRHYALAFESLSTPMRASVAQQFDNDLDPDEIAKKLRKIENGLTSSTGGYNSMLSNRVQRLLTRDVADSQLQKHIKKAMSIFVSNYIDEMEKGLRKIKPDDIINPEDPGWGWDETIVSNIKVEKVYVLKDGAIRLNVEAENVMQMLDQKRVPYEIIQKTEALKLRESNAISDYKNQFRETLERVKSV